MGGGISWEVCLEKCRNIIEGFPIINIWNFPAFDSAAFSTQALPALAFVCGEQAIPPPELLLLSQRIVMLTGVLTGVSSACPERAKQPQRIFE